MAIVVALTAMLHGLAGEQAAAATSHAHAVSALTQDVADQHCCPTAQCPTVGATCAAGGSCSLCVPPAEHAVLPSPAAAETGAAPETPLPEVLLFALFRPPKAFPTV